MIVSDKKELLNILLRSKQCIPVGDIRVRTRCVLCGDSKRDPNKKRLYIKCDPSNPSEPILYNCFNCNESGILNVDMLEMILGGIDSDEIELLKRINKSASRDSGNIRVNKYKLSRSMSLKLPPARRSNSTINKIRYLNRRLGCIIPLVDYPRLKLIFSLKELLEINQLDLSEKYRPFLDLYEQDYIGWLSVNNEFIILRDITGKNKFRYIKINLFGTENNAHSFYTISNSINTLSRNPIKIVVTEGPFDILSVVYNIYGMIIPDCVFMSVNHGSFLNPILYYLNKGLVGSNVYIEIYRDSDSKLDYQLLKKQLRIYTKNFSVFRNSMGKDFGVPKNEFEIEQEI